MCLNAQQAIDAQATVVRKAYAKNNGLSSEYEREFDKLSDMRWKKMADDFRSARGLPPDGKTPYCR